MNVNDQHRDPGSLLHWMERAINTRKEFPEFGWGKYEVLDMGSSKVLAHCRKSEKGLAIALHNFSSEEQNVKLQLEEPDDIVDIFGDKKYETFNTKTQEVTLSAYGYRWMHKRHNFI